MKEIILSLLLLTSGNTLAEEASSTDRCNHEILTRIAEVRPTMEKPPGNGYLEAYLEDPNPLTGAHNWRIPRPTSAVGYNKVKSLCGAGVANELSRQFPGTDWNFQRDKDSGQNHNLSKQVEDLKILDKRLGAATAAAQAVAKESREILDVAKQLRIVNEGGEVISGDEFLKTASPEAQLAGLAALIDAREKPELDNIWVGTKVKQYHTSILTLYEAIADLEKPLDGSRPSANMKKPEPVAIGRLSWSRIGEDLSSLVGGQGRNCSGRLATIDNKLCAEISGDYSKIAAALAAINNYQKPGKGKSIVEVEADQKERVAKQKEALEQAKAREANKKHGERMVDRVGKQFKDVCNGYAFDNAQKEDCVAAMETGGWDKGVNLSEGKFKSAKDENGEYFQFNPGAIKGKVAVLAPIKIYKKNGVYDYKSAYQNIAKQLESQNAARAYTLAAEQAMLGRGGRPLMDEVKLQCVATFLNPCLPSNTEQRSTLSFKEASENMCRGTSSTPTAAPAAVAKKQESRWSKFWTWLKGNSKNVAASGTGQTSFPANPEPAQTAKAEVNTEPPQTQKGASAPATPYTAPPQPSDDPGMKTAPRWVTQGSVMSEQGVYYEVGSFKAKNPAMAKIRATSNAQRKINNLPNIKIIGFGNPVYWEDSDGTVYAGIRYTKP